MNTVFLIGNGFDLACGLKTRYKDVYNSYCKVLDSDSELIKKFKEDISSDYENWSDFEEGMAEYAKKLQNEDEFVESIKDFRNYLQVYLKQEESKFKKYISENNGVKSSLAHEMKKSVEEYYAGITPDIFRCIKDMKIKGVNDVRFISFNYTTVFDVLLQETLMLGNVLHIHGKLDDCLIMGMDNENQIAVDYKLTRRGKQAFVKPYFNNLVDSSQITRARDLIARADVICVFGLSLGKSDLTWRNVIIETLGYSNRHLFLFDYELSCDQSLLLNDKLDLELSKRNVILSSWGIKNPDFYADRIHIPCGKKLFDIASAIKKYETNRTK